MMSCTASRLAFLICVASAVGTVTSQCLYSDAERCLKKLENKSVLLGATPMTNDSLDRYCSNYSKMVSCLDGLFNCAADISDMLSRVRTIEHIICFEKRDEYVRHSTCLSDSAEVRQCVKAYIPFDVYYDIAKLRNVELHCNASRRLLSCLQKASNISCGANATRFQLSLLQAGFQREYQDTDCDLGFDYEDVDKENKGNKGKRSLPMGAIFGVVALVVVIAAVIFVGTRQAYIRYSRFHNEDADDLISSGPPTPQHSHRPFSFIPPRV